MEKKKTDAGVKRIAKIVALSLLFTGLQAGEILAAKGIYDSCFPRYEKRDLNTVYGQFDYSRVEDRLKRITFHFQSEKIKLQGYYYPCEGAKGMVVVCHGMHAGADDYLPFVAYFVEHGYAVFSYDCRGTYASEGDSTVGMCTPLADLDHALNYIEKNPTLSKYPLFLFGHSWGGYAVTSVLSLHKNVKACAAVAPFNDGYTLITEKSVQYAGPLAELATGGIPRKFLEIYQKILFGKYTEHNAVKGINSTNIPVLIAHGKEDGIISFEGQSVISHREEIREENVVYYVGTGTQSGHNTILHSKRAVEYQEKVENDLEKLKKEKNRELTQKELDDFCESVDHSLYSEVNSDLMDAVLRLYESTF